ncbi:MAG: polymer-forming cytoskeletal protein [Natronomonas sp.]
MLGSDPLDELVVPDGTTVEEHDLVADGDVLIGGQSAIELGVRGANVVAGERVRFGGDIEADGDCRLDMWCDVDGNVLVGENAYLGERVHVAGQLVVSGDLDIGDDVDIEQGFEANGWIVIRNPMPTVVFVFVYLSQLLRIGEEEAASELADAFLEDDTPEEPVVLPRSATVSDDAWRVSTPATIGADCRLHGNIRAKTIDVAEHTEIFGSLRAKDDITVGDGTIVHGDVTTADGDVTIHPGAQVRGDVSCVDCSLSESAEVEGSIRAQGATQVVGSDDPPDDERSTPTDAERPETTEEPDAGAVSDGLPADLTPAFVPADPKPAFVPLSAARRDWSETTSTDAESVTTAAETDDSDPSSDPDRNGSGNLAAVIAEAEE